MDHETIRSAPMDVTLEQNVLGALLVDNKLIDVAAGAGLKPESFCDSLHQRIFDTILYLHAEGDVSPTIVSSVMKDDPAWAVLEMPARGYLGRLILSAPALPNIAGLCRVLLDLAVRRDLVVIGEDLVNDAYESPKDQPARITIGRATERLLSIGDLTARRLSKIGDAASASLKRLEERLERARTGQQPASITTGSQRLDSASGGMLAGDRWGLAGRSAMGKSVVASSMSLAAALKGTPALIISADMQESPWAVRVLCDMDRYLRPSEKAIHYRRFRTGGLEPEEWERLVQAQHALSELPLFIDDNPRASVASINGRVRALAQAYPDKQGLVVTDFLQKVDPPETRYRDRRRDEDVTDIAYGLGDIVRPIGWSSLALIQIKSSTDAKGQLLEDAPNVTSIRESAGIEMALDIILSPYRKAFFIERRRDDFAVKALALNEDTPNGWRMKYDLEMLCWKNREGSVSDLNMHLWCDPGSASVRDEDPAHAAANQVQDEDVQGLLPA